MPTKWNHARHRRTQPDRAPWSFVPLVVFTPEEGRPYRSLSGTTRVLRGSVDVDKLSSKNLEVLNAHPGKQCAVFANRLGGQHIVPMDVLVPVDTDYSRRAELLDAIAPPPDLPGTMHDYVTKLRAHADELRQHADEIDALAGQYQELAEDDWEIGPLNPSDHPWFARAALIDVRDDGRPDYSPGARG